MHVRVYISLLFSLKYNSNKSCKTFYWVEFISKITTTLKIITIKLVFEIFYNYKNAIYDT